MLRSAATPNRTQVQSSPEVKQTTIRHPLPTPTASVRFRYALAVMKTPDEINLPH